MNAELRPGVTFDPDDESDPRHPFYDWHPPMDEMLVEIERSKSRGYVVRWSGGKAQRAFLGVEDAKLAMPQFTDDGKLRGYASTATRR